MIDDGPIAQQMNVVDFTRIKTVTRIRGMFLVCVE